MTRATSLARLADWPVRLQRLICARLTQPFAWGSNDCFLFAADVLHAITGHDAAADLRGRYASEREARRLLRELGGMRALAEARFGARTAPALCLPGDVGLAPQGRTVLLVACTGVHWVAPTHSGLQPGPLPLRAWAVAAPVTSHG